MRKRCIALLITAYLTATPFNCIAEEASAPKPETIITTKSGAVYTDDTGKSVTGGKEQNLRRSVKRKTIILLTIKPEMDI